MGVGVRGLGRGPVIEMFTKYKEPIRWERKQFSGP